LLASVNLRDGLLQAGVGHVHWKSNSHLAQALAGETDMDLFVRPKDKAAFSRVMAELKALKILSQPWASYPDVEDWLVFDAASGAFLHLHVHYKLLTGLKRVKHLQLPWEELLLANLRQDTASKWPIPTAEMELLTLLVRLWAKMPPWRRVVKAKLPRHIQGELLSLVGETTPSRVMDLAPKLGLTVNGEALQRLWVSPTDSAVIFGLARQFYAQMRPHYRMSWTKALMRAAQLNGEAVVRRVWLKFGHPIRYGKTLPDGGALIAVIGADGSGKSTLSRDLTRWLRFKLDAHLLYMGSGDGAGGWVHKLRRGAKAAVTSTKKKSVSPTPVSKVRAPSMWEKLYRLLDLHLMRRKVRMLRLGRKLARDGSVIVLDRYPQSQVPGISDGPRQRNGSGFVWAAAAEKTLYHEAAGLGPDMVIKLRVDAQTAQARKPDHGLEAIARKCRIVDDLDFPQSEVVNVDANQPYAQVLMEAKRAVWRYLAKLDA
jgi:thymidylate kinase